MASTCLRTSWHNPARALGLGMPLAFVFMALVTHYLVGLDWTTSFLAGAVLAPTDPVFASAIVGRKEIPAKLRELLNVESGVNDGLALPVVLLLIAAAGPTATGHTGDASLGRIALELARGESLENRQGPDPLAGSGPCTMASGWRDLNPRPLRPERGSGVIITGLFAVLPGQGVGVRWSRMVFKRLGERVGSQMAPTEGCPLPQMTVAETTAGCLLHGHFCT